MIKDVSPASMCRSEVLEAKLERWGFTKYNGEGNPTEETWNFLKIQKNTIDKEASLNNQARIDQPLNEENLEKIKNGVRIGAKMPAILVFLLPNGKYVIADGNHRYTESSDYEYLNAYIVNTNNENLKRRLTRLSNDENGLAHSLEIRTSHAVTEVETFGATEEEACQLFGIPKARLHKEIQLRQFNSYFSVEVPKAIHLDDNVKKEIVALRDQVSISVATEIAKIAVDIKGIVGQNIKEFKDQYKACQTATEQQAFLNGAKGFFNRSICQKTAGGAITNKNKKKNKVLFNKQEFLLKVDKMILSGRLPGLESANFTEEENIRVQSAIGILQSILRKRRMTA